jgi:hypothetical protein
MFRSFDVWKRTENGELIRYRCFESTPEGTFCVQSADFFRRPIQSQRLVELETQWIELLLEQSPFERSRSFPTVEEAIAHHNSEFSGL